MGTCRSAGLTTPRCADILWERPHSEEECRGRNRPVGAGGRCACWAIACLDERRTMGLIAWLRRRRGARASKPTLRQLIKNLDEQHVHRIMAIACKGHYSRAAHAMGWQVVETYTDIQVLELVRDTPITFLNRKPGYTAALAGRLTRIMARCVRAYPSDYRLRSKVVRMN